MRRMHAYLAGALCAAGLALWTPALPARADGPSTGPETGLPLPRFVSLKTQPVNMRTGPGDRYPVVWVYQRAHLPLQIIAEFENWRRVRDPDGEEGWVHGSLLSGTETVLITEATRDLRNRPESEAPVVARAEPGTIGRLLECQGNWCRLEIAGYKGWVRTAEFWGPDG